MPERPSSSSTTRTQSVRFAAQSWLASETVMVSGTVSAALGLSAATVPFWTCLPGRFLLGRACVVEIVRLRESSDSIFLRIACRSSETRFGRVLGAITDLVFAALLAAGVCDCAWTGCRELGHWSRQLAREAGRRRSRPLWRERNLALARQDRWRCRDGYPRHHEGSGPYERTFTAAKRVEQYYMDSLALLLDCDSEAGPTTHTESLCKDCASHTGQRKVANANVYITLHLLRQRSVA